MTRVVTARVTDAQFDYLAQRAVENYGGDLSQAVREAVVFAEEFLKLSDGPLPVGDDPRYLDEVGIDDLADALGRAAETKHAQASADETTERGEAPEGLEVQEWRRRVRQGRRTTQQSHPQVTLRPSCNPVAAMHAGFSLAFAHGDT